MKMYILVRNDLSKSQQAAQGGHALAAFALDWPNTFKEWGNHTIVYLKASYEQLIDVEHEIVQMEGILCSDFSEPYYNNELTALAAYGPNASEYFKGFDLM